MVKAEREVDFEYGLFVEERLSEYTPHSEREIVHFEYPEEEQKLLMITKAIMFYNTLKALCS